MVSDSSGFVAVMLRDVAAGAALRTVATTRGGIARWPVLGPLAGIYGAASSASSAPSASSQRVLAGGESVVTLSH
jgi:hypothetical protein